MHLKLYRAKKVALEAKLRQKTASASKNGIEGGLTTPK